MGSPLNQAQDTTVIRQQVDRILASGVLGRSRFYAALLEYLVDCAERGHTPKEIEIAAAVFSRGEDFDPSQDSMVRVYAHNLRQKLVQYYADRGSDETDQISIPKGEYRLALGSDETQAPAAATQRPSPPPGLRLALLVVVSLAAGIAVDRLWTSNADAPLAEWRAISQSALWRPVSDDELPVTLVVGDYYIFGELDDIGNVGRLVREFSINSSRDLDDRFMLEPEYADQYIDLDLTYLPSSIAVALRDIVEVLAAAGKEIRVVSISNLDTSVIRETHIVYLGYLSGLGMLNDFVFAGSKLAIGDTFDELVERDTGKVFVSEAGIPSGQGSYRDYGLFSTVPGPVGNQLVFVAGTRDEGLMQTADAVTDPAMVQMSIDAVAPDGDTPMAFELLYEVAGLGRTNLDALIVHAAPLDRDRISIGQLLP
jgi:hypothetical protein